MAITRSIISYENEILSKGGDLMHAEIAPSCFYLLLIHLALLVKIVQ